MVIAEPATFRHEALVYAGDAGFLAGTVPFVREAVAAGEPVLVAVGAERIAALRDALGSEAGHVRFADMAQLGANPARIIPEWHEFVGAHPGRSLRGVGEPIWPERTEPEVVECHRHEALLNVAFADTPGFTLLCPYDAERLAPDIVAQAAHTHPSVRAGEDARDSVAFAGVEDAAEPFDEPLPEPIVPVSDLAFDVRHLRELRAVVSARARDAGLDPVRTTDLTAAVNEVAANSVRHGGGEGVARLWQEEGTVLSEVSDRGRILDPLAGRRRPAQGQVGGYGLWLANQLCDLVQVRTFADRSVVRLHMRLA
jgi:anti-sigma regulatory factor (Ser/Thr protein kinase)